MAMTEIQLPEKATFYSQMRGLATNLMRMMCDLGNVSEFVGNLDTGDLDTMGVPTGQVRTDLTNFRTSINEFLAFFEGTSTDQTQVIGDMIEKFRHMS